MKKRLFAALAFLVVTATILSACGKTYSDMESTKRYDYDLSEYIKIPDYMGFKAAFDDPNVCTDDEVAEAVFQVMLTYSDFNDAGEDPAERYDMAVVSYVPFIEEEAMEDSAQTDYQIVIGLSSNSEIDALIAENLIGKKKGDTVYVEYTYPDYPSLYGSMAGRTIVIAVQLQSVNHADVPLVTEEFVQSLNGYSFATVDEFYENVREDIKEQKRTNRIYAVWQAYQEECEVIRYPEKEREEYIRAYLEYYEGTAEEYDVELEELLMEDYGIDIAELHAEAEQSAEEMVKSEMILTELSRRMGITLSDEEYAAGIQEYFESESNGFASLEDYVKHYTEPILRDNLIWDKALVILAENAVPIA